MSDARPTVVADTVIYLQASTNETNVAASFLRRVEAGEVTLCISRQMIVEILDVLTRPEIRLKNARLSNEELEGFILSIEANALLIDPLPEHYRYVRDPNDEHVLNLAIEAKAQYLLSYDKDLLILTDDSRSEGRAFQHEYPELTILGAGEFITRLNLLQDQDRNAGDGPAF
jgi:putative PIN family toxin of toxin-antitoxin system